MSGGPVQLTSSSTSSSHHHQQQQQRRAHLKRLGGGAAPLAAPTRSAMQRLRSCTGERVQRRRGWGLGEGEQHEGHGPANQHPWLNFVMAIAAVVHCTSLTADHNPDASAPRVLLVQSERPGRRSSHAPASKRQTRSPRPQARTHDQVTQTSPDLPDPPSAPAAASGDAADSWASGKSWP